MKRALPFLCWAAFGSATFGFAACGSSEESASPPSVPAPTPAPARPTAPDDPPDDPPNEASLVDECVPGYPTPFTPSAEQLRQGNEALSVHRRGDFHRAASLFRALLDDAPGYGSARFNLACAQAQAGLLEEAKGTLALALCQDLPTNLPRALADQDLAALRADIQAMGTQLSARYREASAGGVALVAFGKTLDGEEGERSLYWSQPGLWKEGRFVPAGPRQQARAQDWEAPMFPSFVADDRVVQVETISSQAEADVLPPLRVVERSLFDGVERANRRFDESQNDFYRVRLGVHEGQTWVQFDSVAEPVVLRTVALASGVVMESPPVESAAIEFGMSQWQPDDAPAPIHLSRRASSVSYGSKTIDLDGAHRRMFRHRVIAQGDVALVHSFDVGDCGSPDRFMVEAIDLATGTSLWKDRGEGQRLFRFQDGQLWMQSNDAFFVFPDARQAERTELPSGLGLSSTFLAFNPMC